MNRFLFILTILGLNGCCLAFASDYIRYQQCPANYDINDSVFKYKINDDTKSLQGIKIDRTYFEVDLEKLDTLTNELEKCLNKPIARCAYRIKISPESYLRGPGLWTIYCGKEPCAGFIQSPATIVTTPDLSSYKHELIHLVMHYTNTDHDREEFKRCQ